MKLTPTDHLILNTCKQILEGFSAYLGTGYEIVLHSLEDYDHAAIKVLNGFHSGRSEGAPITSMALNILGKVKKNDDPAKAYIYQNTSHAGEPIHACTIPVLGEKGRIIGLICMNFYLNTPFYEIMKTCFLQMQPPEQDFPRESFSQNTQQLVQTALEKAKVAVYSDPSISAANKNKKIIEDLLESNIFTLKNSVDITAKYLGLSKNTVYLHIRNAKQQLRNEAHHV